MESKERITTIGDLFHIEYGQKEYHNKEWLEGNEGETILISSKGEDNGIYGFFDIKPKYNQPVITVPGYGTIGQAFVQEFPCAVDDHLLILIPKEKLTIEELFQVAYQIRLDKWKYKYGRGITPKRLSTQKIRLIKSKIKYKDFVKKITPKKVKKEKIEKYKKIKWVKVTELCNISKKTALPQNQLEQGNTPYVTTTSKNNGISGFFDEQPTFKGKCLTVALNGSVGETFFQFDNFITSGDNAVLTLKEGYNPYLLFYIGAMIKKSHQWRYNYYRKLSMTRLKKMQIPVPYKNEKEIDINYIKNIIMNSYGYDSLKSYL